MPIPPIWILDRWAFSFAGKKKDVHWREIYLTQMDVSVLDRNCYESVFKLKLQFQYHTVLKLRTVYLKTQTNQDYLFYDMHKQYL